MLQYAPRSGGLWITVVSELRAGIARQLAGAQALLESSQSIQGVEALHFKPPGSSHYYTFLYPIAKVRFQLFCNLQANFLSLTIALVPVNPRL